VVVVDRYLLLSFKLNEIRIRLIKYEDGICLAVLDLLSDGREVGRQEFADSATALDTLTDAIGRRGSWLYFV
jgi:hypothetical protein